jgi:hypothetical protein
MTKELWNELLLKFLMTKLGLDNGNLYLSNIDDWLLLTEQNAVMFIMNLLKNGISLDDIDVNDWNSSLYNYVYVGGVHYSRFRKGDWRKALGTFKKRSKK